MTAPTDSWVAQCPWDLSQRPGCRNIQTSTIATAKRQAILHEEVCGAKAIHGCLGNLSWSFLALPSFTEPSGSSIWHDSRHSKHQKTREITRMAQYLSSKTAVVIVVSYFSSMAAWLTAFQVGKAPWCLSEAWQRGPKRTSCRVSPKPRGLLCRRLSAQINSCHFLKNLIYLNKKWDCEAHHTFDSHPRVLWSGLQPMFDVRRALLDFEPSQISQNRSCHALVMRNDVAFMTHIRGVTKMEALPFMQIHVGFGF